MFGIFKYFWTVVFLCLCYAGYYFGMPMWTAYRETGAVYEKHGFYDGDLYKEDYRVNARKMLAEDCKLGVQLMILERLSCRPPLPKHVWE